MQEEKQKVFGLVTRFYGEPGWKQISRFFSSSEYPLRDMADLKKRLITIMVCQLELAKPENWSKYFKLDEPKTAFIFEQDYKQLIRFWLVSHIDPDINNIEQSLDSLTFLKEVPLLEIMEIKSSGKAGILKQWCSNKLQLYRDNLLSIVRNISPGDGNFNKAATIYEFIFWAERIPLYSDNWNSKPNELFQKALNFFFEHVKNLSDGQQARFIIRILTIFYGIRIDEKYLGVNAIKSICEIFISKSQQFNERGLAESGIAERITTSESVDYSLCQYLLKRLRAKEETEDESEEAEIIREIISEISLRKTAYQDILTNKFDNWDCKCILDFLKKHLDLYEDDAIKKFFSGFDAYLESRINADKPDAIFYRYKILGAEKNLAEAKNLLLQKENIFLNISLEQKNLPKNSLAEIFRDLIDHYQGLPDVPDAQEKSRSACRKMLQLLFNGEPQFFDYFGKYDLIDGFIDFLTKENIVESRDIWYRAKEFLSDQLIERKEFEKIFDIWNVGKELHNDRDRPSSEEKLINTALEQLPNEREKIYWRWLFSTEKREQKPGCLEDQIIEYEKDFSALFSTSTPQETKTRAAQIYLTYAIGKLADPPGISDSTDASPFFQFFPSLDVVVEATYNSLLLDPEIENNYLEPYFGAQSSGVHFPIIAPLIKQVLEYAKRLRYGRLKESALIEPILSALPKKQTEKIEIKIV